MKDFKIVEKKVSKLKVGDKVKGFAGNMLTVKELSKGMYWNSTMITFRNGEWSCCHNNTIVSVHEAPVVQ